MRPGWAPYRASSSGVALVRAFNNFRLAQPKIFLQHLCYFRLVIVVKNVGDRFGQVLRHAQVEVVAPCNRFSERAEWIGFLNDLFCGRSYIAAPAKLSIP